MGYHAYAYAELKLKPNMGTNKVEEDILSFTKEYGAYCCMNRTNDAILFESDDKYYEDAVEAFCFAFAKYIMPGEAIEFIGEDEERWRFKFTGDEDEYECENALSVYASDLYVDTQILSGNPTWSVTTSANGIVVTDENGNSMLIKPLY